jgi:hypothetical protein
MTMPPLISLAGMRFDRLVVIRRAGHNPRRQVLWLCGCDCGSETTVRGTDLRRSMVRSCGCLRDEKTRQRAVGRRGSAHPSFKHGRPSEYNAYRNAKDRCTRRRNHAWKRYGGRGIKFLFTSYEHWVSVLGPKPSPSHSVDRFPDNNGNYEPGNVRWATWTEQNRNKSQGLKLQPLQRKLIK